jgi:hypothetical protein
MSEAKGHQKIQEPVRFWIWHSLAGVTENEYQIHRTSVSSALGAWLFA